MRIVAFCHSLRSDWNHGNAHFLRGVVRTLLERGHQVAVYEPADGWSLQNLTADHGLAAADAYRASYPGLDSTPYQLEGLDLDRALEGADLVLVHEWNEPELVRRVGAHRAQRGSYCLLFHDTHHRMVTQPAEMARQALGAYDGVLAFGEALRALYLSRGLAGEAYTWHEAADTAVFAPRDAERERDLVWVGNWGDGERSEELSTFLLEPVRRLRLRAAIHGVRYPAEALAALFTAGVDYRGFLPNHRVPDAFARARLTVHVPRRPYVEALPGVPTIRVFEALACGIPLVSAPWDDVEGLFRPGEDFLFAADGEAMTSALRTLLHEPAWAAALAAEGLATVRARHTCTHRVDELLAICARLGVRGARARDDAAHTRHEETPWQAS